MKANLEKKTQANESVSYDYLNKSLKDKKQDKYYLPKQLKPIRDSENDAQNLERNEIEKMRLINEQVKNVEIIHFFFNF